MKLGKYLCLLFDKHNYELGKEEAIWSNGDITYYIKKWVCKRCGKK